MFWHFLLHILGIDTQQSKAYDFWSGVSTQLRLSSVGLIWIFYHRHNCHVHRCWRIGRFEHDQYMLCKKHHPAVPERITHEDILTSYNGEVTNTEVS